MKWQVYKHAHPGESWFQGVAYGRLLTEARTKTGLSMEQLTQKVGKIPARLISAIEGGRQMNIAPEFMKRLVKTLGTTEDKLFGRQAQVDQFLIDATRLEYLGTFEGTIDEAMAYGRSKADIDQGSLLAIPEGKEPPEQTKWAIDFLAERHGITNAQDARKRRKAQGYRERVASKGEYNEGVERFEWTSRCAVGKGANNGQL